jgi:hypothetical protein
VHPHVKAAVQNLFPSSFSHSAFSTIQYIQINLSNSTIETFYCPISKMTDSTAVSKPSKLPVTVNKPTPYTFDLGLLLAEDPNPLLLSSPANLEADLAATARDGAQALLNQLLSTCPIAATPNGVLLSLPEISTRLPREKVRFSRFSCFPHMRGIFAQRIELVFIYITYILTWSIHSRSHHRKL